MIEGMVTVLHSEKPMEAEWIHHIDLVLLGWLPNKLTEGTGEIVLTLFQVSDTGLVTSDNAVLSLELRTHSSNHKFVMLLRD